ICAVQQHLSSAPQSYLSSSTHPLLTSTFLELDKPPVPSPRQSPFPGDTLTNGYHLDLSKVSSVSLGSLSRSSPKSSVLRIPYVSISHPNRGCDIWAEGLPTFGRVKNASIIPVKRIPPPSFIPRCHRAASLQRETTPSLQHRHSPSLLSATSAFEAGRDGLVRGASPLVSLVTEAGPQEAPPTKASPAFTLRQEAQR
ncbi:hypothetical protein GOODEAATRI_010777, partial [Goodea atripinnis]